METEDVLGTSGKELPAAKFTPVDYIIFSLMVVTSIGIGVISGIRSRSRATTQEYLLGSRTMSPVPVAFSLLGGAISAISLLGNPAEMYFFGTQLVMNLLGFIPGCLFISQVITPIFYQLKLVSITEYLQVRFESRLLRTLGTLCLLLFNFIYMGLCLYAPTLSLSIVTGLSTSTSILILGFVCTFYITIGGVKAVIYTDVLQTLILLIGMLLVVIICTTDVGGVGSVWSVAERGGRIILFDFNTSPYERHTFLSTVIFGFNAAMMHVGINQSAYQRFASVRTLQISKNLMMVFMLGYTMVHLLLYYAGLVAFASYWDCDPLTSGRIEKPDQIIPFLVINKLSHLTGVAGVFVAAVYSGVLSTLSSCGNSIACVIWEDFLKDRPYFSHLSDAGATNVTKLLSAAAGLAAICTGLIVEKLGSLINVASNIFSAITGSLSGVIIMGICAPWVNAKGAIAGFVTTFVFSIWVVIGKFVRGGGSPPLLPLSVQGCPENLVNFNTTISNLITNTSVINTLLANPTIVNGLTVNTSIPDDLRDITSIASDLINTTNVQESSAKTIYEISYCFSGVINLAITFVVSSVVSVLTGVVHPKAEDGVVCRVCGRIYLRLWQLFSNHNTCT